jgi:hypothetical protein
MFFAEIMRKDRSILDFLDARYTFLNERLAKHYGIPGVQGDQFRRVEFAQASRRASAPGVQRAGILTHASILTITSNPTRTSPVKRGKWVLENIFDQKPPDPPANVPELDEKKIAAGNLSLRKQLEIHRSNAVCASCHTTMDAIGFGLENFDAVGRWRTIGDTGEAIDASGAMPDGASFDGVEGLKRQLASSDLFLTTMTEKLLTYALGRGVAYHDMPAVRRIVVDAADDDYRLSSFIMGVVESVPFRMRRTGA